MPDLTICIACRGNGLGLWSTVEGCEADLEHSGISYNYSIVQNGDKKPDNGALILLKYLHESGKLAFKEVRKEPMSPPSARQLASANADGHVLAFLDNHAIVHRDYFKRALMDFEQYGCDMLHSTTQFHPGNKLYYHYSLLLDTQFWGTSSLFTPTHKPYKIAAGGHGGFFVTRASWEEVGGYGPDELFEGYAGEELTTDLKYWMLGKTVWLDPKMVHSHYVGVREYKRHYTDDYYINLMVSANVIGGQSYLDRVAKYFCKVPRALSERTIYDLMQIAYRRSNAYAKELASKRLMDLPQLLQFFQRECIEH